MMQLYQNHVVFQSFSDLYYLDQRAEQIKQRKQAAAQAAAAAAAAEESASGSSSTSSTPCSSRAPSLFHELSRSSSNESIESDTNSVQTIEDGEQNQSSSVQYYPAGLFNSSVHTRLANKEADLVTLNDESFFQSSDATATAGVNLQELSLRRF